MKWIWMTAVAAALMFTQVAADACGTSGAAMGDATFLQGVEAYFRVKGEICLSGGGSLIDSGFADGQELIIKVINHSSEHKCTSFGNAMQAAQTIVDCRSDSVTKGGWRKFSGGMEYNYDPQN